MTTNDYIIAVMNEMMREMRSMNHKLDILIAEKDGDPDAR